MSKNVIVLGMSNALAVKLNNNGQPEIVRDCQYDLVGTECVAFRTNDSARYSVGKSARVDSYDDGNRLIEFFADGLKKESKECLSSLLEYILEYTRANGEDFSDASICCPSYFDKGIIKEAAHKAGICVDAFINEEEAVLAFCRKEPDMQHSTVLVCDLGGACFDVYLLMVDDLFNAIGQVHCNHNLGGKQWTNIMKELLLSKVVEETGLTPDELDDETLWEISDKAEFIKMVLSFKNSVRTTLWIYDEKHCFSISRKEFEECAEKYTEAIRFDVKGYISKIERDFDHILLLGGSSKMPMIREAMTQSFPGKEIIYGNGCILAYGAVYAANPRSTYDGT